MNLFYALMALMCQGGLSGAEKGKPSASKGTKPTGASKGTKPEAGRVTYSNGDTFKGGVLTIKKGTFRVKPGAYKGRKDVVEVRFPVTVV